MKIIYIIEYVKGESKNISSEGYLSYEDAVGFIKSRSNYSSLKKISPYVYAGEDCEYKIHDVCVRGL